MGAPFNVLGFVVGPGSMIVSDGADHRRRRGSVQAAFSRRRLEGWIPVIMERTDAAIDRVAADGDHVRDLYVDGRELVLDLVVRILFGERLAHRAAEIGALFQRPQDYLESPAIRQLPHPLPARHGPASGPTGALDRIVDAEIADRRARPSGDPLDVLEALVADGTLTTPRSGTRWSPYRRRVRHHLGDLSWLLWCTTLADGVWQQLRARRTRCSARSFHVAVPDGTTLRALDLAARVVRETTRLHPAGVVSPRQAVEDLVIGGHEIPAGTLVLWSAHLAGRDPRPGTTPSASTPTGSWTSRRSARPSPTPPGCPSGGAPGTASGSPSHRWS